MKTCAGEHHRLDSVEKGSCWEEASSARKVPKLAVPMPPMPLASLDAESHRQRSCRQIDRWRAMVQAAEVQKADVRHSTQMVMSTGRHSRCGQTQSSQERLLAARGLCRSTAWTNRLMISKRKTSTSRGALMSRWRRVCRYQVSKSFVEMRFLQILRRVRDCRREGGDRGSRLVEVEACTA